MLNFYSLFIKVSTVFYLLIFNVNYSISEGSSTANKDFSNAANQNVENNGQKPPWDEENNANKLSDTGFVKSSDEDLFIKPNIDGKSLLDIHETFV